MTASGLSSVVVVGLCLGCIGCSSAAHENGEPDEMHSSAPAELLRLSQEAQAAIGLETETVRQASLHDSLPATGWLVVPPGREAQIKAAAAGFCLPVNDRSPLEIGTRVAENQQLASLRVFVSPQEAAQLVVAKEEADILINQSLVSLRLAEEQLDRVRKTPQVVSGTRLIELEEIVERARVAHREAQEKLPFLPTEPYAETLDLKTVSITSPLAGQVTAIHVVPRQLVVAGDPLWTVADWFVLWLRVPVFAGDLPSLHDDEPALVTIPGSITPIATRRIARVPPGDPGRRTVDVYYEVENPSNALRPGQAVSVALPVGETTQRAVIPRSAVVWDGLSNPWVYVRIPPDAFRRQRVELGQAEGDVVSIKRGLREGQEIVTIGAESLYGEEFKEQIQVADED